MSAPIARILKRARDIGNGDSPEVLTPDDFVFPHCGQIAARDALRATGHALPHTYRTLAADCGIDDILSHVLLGHTPRNVSEQYITRLVLTAGPTIRAAQRKAKSLSASLNC